MHGESHKHREKRFLSKFMTQALAVKLAFPCASVHRAATENSTSDGEVMQNFVFQ